MPSSEATIEATSPSDVDTDFAEYMAARQGRLLRVAYLLCGRQHEAEDLVQTTLAKVYLNWARVREADSMDAYVRRILVNEHNSLLRRAWRRFESPREELPEGRTEDRYDHGDASALWQQVATLPPRQRAVIVLRYYEQLSEAEIASTLGISTGTVKSQASRALATLRSTLPEEAP